MGMFNMPQVEGDDQTAPMPQGMMSGSNVAQMPQGGNPDTAHGKYNGVVVDPEGGKAEVKNGVVKVNGTPYFVSDSGAMVIDGNGQLIGHIEDGKFGVVTDEYMQSMQQKGYIQ